MQTLKLELFADYFQFYIQDDDVKFGDLSEAWSDKAVDDMIAVSEHGIGIGTARNMDVPVTVNIVDEPHDLNDGEWDRVNRRSIDCDTGRLVIAGCTDFFPDAHRVKLAPGRYNITVGYKDLKNLSEDGLDGTDSYHVFIAPA